MKVYFHGTPRAFKDLLAEHMAIYKAVESLRHVHLSKVALSESEKVYAADHEEVIKMYEETMRNLRQADLLIVEASTTSVSIGYLINKALEQSKPVIALYLKDHAPFFLSGISSERLQLIEYSLENISEVLSDAFDYAKDSTDVRFNFFISPSQVSYLDWIAQKKRIPRSVYLRKLITESMSANKEYSETSKTTSGD